MTPQIWWMNLTPQQQSFYVLRYNLYLAALEAQAAIKSVTDMVVRVLFSYFSTKSTSDFK